MIAFDHPLGIRDPCLFNRLRAVDHVSPVARDFNAVYNFRVRRTRFGVLACHAAHLDNRFPTSIHENRRHLQNDL